MNTMHPCWKKRISLHIYLYIFYVKNKINLCDFFKFERLFLSMLVTTPVFRSRGGNISNTFFLTSCFLAHTDKLLNSSVLSWLSNILCMFASLILVFNQGEEGTSWYIIQKGSVNVVIYGKVRTRHVISVNVKWIHTLSFIYVEWF